MNDDLSYDEDEDEDDDDDVALVRPYSRTGGRTRSAFDLALEALVSTCERADLTYVDAEHVPIVELCRQVRSVAEVAALARIPIGVVRILIADMAELGLVSVHRTAAPSGPPIAILERVLAGLRRL